MAGFRRDGHIYNLRKSLHMEFFTIHKAPNIKLLTINHSLQLTAAMANGLASISVEPNPWCLLATTSQ